MLIARRHLLAAAMPLIADRALARPQRVPIDAGNALIGPVQDGLLGWWRFNELGGLIAKDSSLCGRNGVLQAGPTRSTNQFGKGALSFVGTSSQYVALPLLSVSATVGFTACGWLYRATTNQHGAVFKVGNATAAAGGDGCAFGVGLGGSSPALESAGNIALGLFDGKRWLNSAYTLGTGWYHWAFIANSAGGLILINGVIQYSDTSGVMGAIGSAGTPVFQIGGYTGQSSGAVNRFFTGSIFGTRLYNRQLAQSEIVAIYNYGA